ncbi:hypothetical protein [Hyphomicrobium sp.]|uniref:hypothetical protein n=1 Tax=Hyphomicrobium sp. TaxID=82 RepID=UPI000F931B77|nr:hypothetical protein [Hyphomicrobium sp.]RUP10435.1 MAG: hypothetical protein EKK38_02575 [Hyphomicrobium sp.]
MALTALTGAVLISGLVCNADDGWAKRNKSPSSASSDPCAEPTAFIKQRIDWIRDLQKSLDSGSDNLASWIQHMEGQKSVDQDKVAKIAELRHDADSVNNLLRAGGCPAVDIDHELSTSAAAGTASPSK